MSDAHVLQGSNICEANRKKLCGWHTKPVWRTSTVLWPSRPCRAPHHRPGKSATTMPTLGAPVGGGLIAGVEPPPPPRIWTSSLLWVVVSLFLSCKHFPPRMPWWGWAWTGYRRVRALSKHRKTKSMSPEQANFSPWAGRGTTGRIQCVYHNKESGQRGMDCIGQTVTSWAGKMCGRGN